VFCENPGTVLTNRKEGIRIQKRIVKCTPSLQKFFFKSKAFGVKRLGTSKFKIKLKKEQQNIEQLADPMRI
jgi:hypothetical protein